MAFVKITEQPSLYDNLEKKSVLEILQDINTEDQKVALAVKKAIPQIEKLVSQIVPRMKQGGRIFYMGAGTSGRLGVLDASEIPPTFGMPPTIRLPLTRPNCIMTDVVIMLRIIFCPVPDFMRELPVTYSGPTIISIATSASFDMGESGLLDMEPVRIPCSLAACKAPIT